MSSLDASTSRDLLVTNCYWTPSMILAISVLMNLRKVGHTTLLVWVLHAEDMWNCIPRMIWNKVKWFQFPSIIIALETLHLPKSCTKPLKFIAAFVHRLLFSIKISTQFECARTLILNPQNHHNPSENFCVYGWIAHNSYTLFIIQQRSNTHDLYKYEFYKTDSVPHHLLGTHSHQH